MSGLDMSFKPKVGGERNGLNFEFSKFSAFGVIRFKIKYRKVSSTPDARIWTLDSKTLN